MTIRDIGNGWTDHSDEGPSPVLLYKGDYMVHQSAYGSEITAQIDSDAEDVEIRKFKKVEDAKAWVNKKVAASKKRKVVKDTDTITVIGDTIILRGYNERSQGLEKGSYSMDKHIEKYVETYRVVSHSITTDQFGNNAKYTVIMEER